MKKYYYEYEKIVFSHIYNFKFYISKCLNLASNKTNDGPS